MSHALVWYNPNVTSAPPSLRAARSFCYRVARTRFEPYSLAALIVSRRMLPHLHAVYAWWTFTRDLARRMAPMALLQAWRDELHRTFDGQPRHPITVALRATIHSFDLPRSLFDDLLFAAEQERLVKLYATFTQLREHCRYAAEPLGRILLRLGGVSSPRAEVLVDSLSTGLRLTDICRDVGHDLDAGRLYLPSDERWQFGCSDQLLFARRLTPEFEQLMRFQVARAREFVLRGLPVVDLVSGDIRLGVELLARRALAILDRIDRERGDVLIRRQALSWWEQTRLLAAALRQRI